MLYTIRRYQAYNPSGVPWLEMLPDYWRTERAKWLFRKMQRPVRVEDQVVTCFRDGTVTLRKNRRERGFTESLKEIGYQGVRRGDLVIHAMDAFAGAAGVSDADGKCSPVYAVCEPVEGASARYYAYIVREMARSQWIAALATGIRERSTDFRFEAFARQRVPQPPLDEQTAIVRFLDHADRRIRRYIRAKKKLIALLNEQKKVMIHRTVTYGLHSDARLKRSRLDWLGDVPEHWEVVALRLRYSQCLGKMLDSKRVFGVNPLPYLRNTDVQWDRVEIAGLPLMDIGPSEYERYTVKPGDLLVCEGGEVGRSAIWNGALEPCGFQKALHRLRPLAVDRDVPRFLLYVFRVATAAGAFDDGHESTIPHLTGEKLRAHRFLFPPKAEQLAIVAYLDQRGRDIDEAVEAVNRELDALREYRTRLIADVVTGKLDVREVAAQLPDEPDEVPEGADAVADGEDDVAQDEDLVAVAAEPSDDD